MVEVVVVMVEVVVVEDDDVVVNAVVELDIADVVEVVDGMLLSKKCKGTRMLVCLYLGFLIVVIFVH